MPQLSGSMMTEAVRTSKTSENLGDFTTQYRRLEKLKAYLFTIIHPIVKLTEFCIKLTAKKLQLACRCRNSIMSQRKESSVLEEDI